MAVVKEVVQRGVTQSLIGYMLGRDQEHLALEACLRIGMHPMIIKELAKHPKLMYLASSAEVARKQARSQT